MTIFDMAMEAPQLVCLPGGCGGGGGIGCGGGGALKS
jgi:hypothetical protein